MSRPLVAGGLALAAMLTIGSVLTPTPIVTLSAGAGGPNVCWTVDEGDTFALVFQHSMYGGEVRETFRVNGSTLTRIRVTTENAAAAEYYAYDGRIQSAADGYKVVVPSATMDDLVIMLDRIGQHRLRFADAEIALTTPGSEPVAATLSVRSVPLATRWLPLSC